MFSDGPIGMYVSELTQVIHGGGKKSDYYNVKLALDALADKGRAFVTVPGNILFSVNKK